MSIFPKSAVSGDSIEKYYLSGIFTIMKSNRAKPAKQRDGCAKPSTIKNALNSLRKLFNFSLGRRVYIGISKHEIEVTLVRLDEMCKVLRQDSTQRNTPISIHQMSLIIGIAQNIPRVRYLS